MNRRHVAAGGAALVAAAGLWSLVTAPSAWASTVTLQRGETLGHLAMELHTTVAALVAANHLADPNRVYAGQVLIVPGTGGGGGPASASTPAGTAPSNAAASQTVVVVTRGETLSAIATRFHVSVASLAAANHLADPNRVVAGSSVVIPSVAPASPVPTLSSPAGPPPAATMQLLAYSVPAPGAGTGTSGLPASLRAHPDRLALTPVFAAAAARYGVPRPLLEAMCWWESGWQANIVSRTGAYGVCQVEPATVAFIDKYLVSSPLDPKVPGQNIALGAAYLADLLHATGGDVGLALAGYYQGLTYVRVFGMLPDTTTYVRGIEAYTTIFAGAGL